MMNGKMPANMGMNKMFKKMQKQIAELQQDNKSIKKSVDKEVKSQVQEKLAKMGYHEEQRKSPKLLPTSGHNEVPIIKGEPAAPTDPTKIADDLSELSWNQLWTMRIQMENGNTDGMPSELIR